MKGEAWLRLTVRSVLMGWFCVVSAVLGVAGDHASFHLRAGGGMAFSGNTVFADADCHAASPAALFGCGDGNDGRPLGAYGDAENSPVVDLAIGYRWNHWLSTELLFSFRSDLPFAGESNFIQLDPAIRQGVSADVCSTSALVVGVVRPLALLGREPGSLEPVVLAGVGIARNNLDPMVFVFPNTETVTPDGRHTGFAWTAGIGLTRELKRNISLAFSWRYVDLGRMETEAGAMTIRERGTGNVLNDSIVIGVTRADLAVNEFIMSVTWHF